MVCAAGRMGIGSRRNETINVLVLRYDFINNSGLGLMRVDVCALRELGVLSQKRATHHAAVRQFAGRNAAARSPRKRNEERKAVVGWVGAKGSAMLCDG